MWGFSLWVAGSRHNYSSSIDLLYVKSVVEPFWWPYKHQFHKPCHLCLQLKGHIACRIPFTSRVMPEFYSDPWSSLDSSANWEEKHHNTCISHLLQISIITITCRLQFWVHFHRRMTPATYLSKSSFERKLSSLRNSWIVKKLGFYSGGEADWTVLASGACYTGMFIL